MPRTPSQRRVDTEHRMEHEVDAWVATASPDGVPHLIPLSFVCDGEALVMATATSSVTVRNLERTPLVRVAMGHTRDVSMFAGTAELLPISALADTIGDRFARHTGFDPRGLADYCWVRVVPDRIQAWREVEEMQGRELMRDGAWLV